jgi:serine kinase of HPr protein (carbohydrate metabolism regulator)
VTTIHASCVVVNGTGVLIRGAAGAGKSRLAHKILLAAPVYGFDARLVADDRVALRAGEGGLSAAAPDPLKGLIEVRGLGIVRLPYVEQAPLGIVIDLMEQGEIPRMPDAEQSMISLQGVTLPRVFALTPEIGLEVLLILIGQSGAVLESEMPLASVRFDGKTERP